MLARYVKTPFDPSVCCETARKGSVPWTLACILTQAATEVGVRVDIRSERENSRSVSVRFGLKTAPPLDGKRRHKAGEFRYGRRSVHITNRDGSMRRIPGAVCWHGHRDFMRAVFSILPDVRITSRLADYRGVVDFEAKYRDTAHRNVGSQFHPCYYAEACDCDGWTRAGMVGYIRG